MALAPYEESHVIGSLELRGYNLIKIINPLPLNILLSRDGEYLVAKAIKLDQSDTIKLATTEITALKKVTIDGCALYLQCIETTLQLDKIVIIITKYVEGMDLATYVANFPQQSQSFKFVRAFLTDMITALHTLHSVGLAHRNIKLQNIIYNDKSDVFTLVDLTSSCLNVKCQTATKHNQLFTSGKYLRHTLINELPVTLEMEQRNDWYAIGAIAYWLLYRKYPYPLKGVTAGKKIFLDFSKAPAYTIAVNDATEENESVVYVIKLLLDDTKAFTSEKLYQVWTNREIIPFLVELE